MTLPMATPLYHAKGGFPIVMPNSSHGANQMNWSETATKARMAMAVASFQIFFAAATSAAKPATAATTVRANDAVATSAANNGARLVKESVCVL